MGTAYANLCVGTFFLVMVCKMSMCSGRGELDVFRILEADIDREWGTRKELAITSPCMACLPGFILAHKWRFHAGFPAHLGLNRSDARPWLRFDIYICKDISIHQLLGLIINLKSILAG